MIITINVLTPPTLFMLILSMSGGINSLKSIPNDRYLEKLFMKLIYQEFKPRSHA